VHGLLEAIEDVGEDKDHLGIFEEGVSEAEGGKDKVQVAKENGAKEGNYHISYKNEESC
jgi:hypothetical protein